jgi:hypothetical protein
MGIMLQEGGFAPDLTVAQAGRMLLPDTENADVGGVHDADEKPGNSGGVVGEVPGSVGEVPD